MTHRVSRFLTVGAIGFVLQISALMLLTQAVGWPYEPATALAVALAVLHNFWWHERWTWRDRTGTRPGLAGRIARYYLTTGATSIAGNLAITVIGVELFGWNPIAANAAAVAGSSLANFLISDRWVFARVAAVATLAVCLSAGPASGAEPRPETIASWNAYVAATEHRLGSAREADRPAPEPWGNEIGVPGGAIHDWRGSILIRGVTVDRLLRSLMYPGTPPPQEDVLEARVLGRSADSLRVYLKLVRRTIMTVTYDTEHTMTFRRQSATLATSRSVATRIAEIDGRDRGFLWRLNSYWRYLQVGGDVRVDLQSLSLSREVPFILRPAAGPVISRIARESLTRTLEALRRHLAGPNGAGSAS
jgi:putative flippase GtrA